MARSELSEAEYKALCKRVFIRDGWRCRNPQCKRKNGLHAHHVTFRSQQGPDETWNMATICNVCHDRIHTAVINRLVILAKSGDPNDTPNADIGLRFITEEGTRNGN